MSIRQHVVGENPEEGPRILVSFTGVDPLNTIAPIMRDIHEGMVPDTPENRLNAALACIVQLTRRIVKLENTCLGLIRERREMAGLAVEQSFKEED